MSAKSSHGSNDGSLSDKTIPIEQLIHSNDADVLKAAVSDPGLTEDLALVLLKRPDLLPEILEQLSRKAVARDRKVRLALVSHRRTPHYASVALVRQMFTFDLMQVALTPIVPADVKRAAEDVLLNKLEALTTGEKLSLALRASGRVAAALLLDAEMRICHAALDNARVTEVQVIKALSVRNVKSGFIQAVCAHPKWSIRREVRMALLKIEKLQLPQALELARGFAPTLVREILRNSRLPAHIRQRVLDAIKD